MKNLHVNIYFWRLLNSSCFPYFWPCKNLSLRSFNTYKRAKSYNILKIRAKKIFKVRRPLQTILNILFIFFLIIYITIFNTDPSKMKFKLLISYKLCKFSRTFHYMRKVSIKNSEPCLLICPRISLCPLELEVTDNDSF